MSIGSIYSIIFDPPMLHMRFDTENHPEYPELLNLHATGKDGIGSFSLEGSIDQNNGSIKMLKTYNQILQWHWSCIMTLFGILGTWRGQEWGGWVWLWRTRKDAASS